MSELSPEGTARWTADMRAALAALRLNRHFPPWGRLRDWLPLLADEHGVLRLDGDSGLPAPRCWVRARVEQELAAETLEDLEGIDVSGLPDDERDRLAERRARMHALAALEPMPTRHVQVALRRVEGERASYRVTIDRLDLATATLGRYSIALSDVPGRHLSRGELEVRATETFGSRLDLLATQDAALAFAVLEQQGIDVEEIVRGVVGPGATPSAGPVELRALAGEGPMLSARLERASIHLEGGRVDDPLPGSLVVPTERGRFGLTCHRKWACPEAAVPALRQHLSERGSRNLVYGYTR